MERKEQDPSLPSGDLANENEKEKFHQKMKPPLVLVILLEEYGYKAERTESVV